MRMRVSLSRLSRLCDYLGITPLSVYESCEQSASAQYRKRKWEQAQAVGYIPCGGSSLYSFPHYFEKNFGLGSLVVAKFLNVDDYNSWYYDEYEDEEGFNLFLKKSEEEMLNTYFREMDRGDKDQLLAIAFIQANKKNDDEERNSL